VEATWQNKRGGARRENDLAKQTHPARAAETIWRTNPAARAAETILAKQTHCGVRLGSLAAVVATVEMYGFRLIPSRPV
jgi:hypothetical protein